MASPLPLADRVVNRLARTLPQRSVAIESNRPIVSFTFDDAPESALSNGARILEGHGVCGTYYVAGGLSGLMHDGETMIDDAGYRRLAAAGHELGHHTFSHGTPRQLGRRYVRDLDRNDAYLGRLAGGKPRNFAFPYGLSAPWAHSAVRRRFRSSRGITVGINRGTVNRDYLKSVEIRGHSALPDLMQWIDEVSASPGWLIFFTHGVSDKPGTYGCQTEFLDRLVGHAVDSGCEVLTVDAALDRLGVA